ncbi:MAG: pilus assembly protein PilM [Planctomycetota bacterium]|jgi:Tfp pilus assembly PilM family ATPase
MRWQPTSRRTPIGIDVNGRFLHAVQLGHGSGGWRIEAAASIRRPVAAGPVDREAAASLATVLERQGFRGVDVVLAVPTQQLMFCHLHVPVATPTAAIGQIARRQLATSNKCEPHSLEVACWELPAPARAKEGKWAQVVGCDTTEANDVMDCFDEAGLNVRALDVESWAAARACEPKCTRSSELSALLNLGWAAAHLVVLRGGTIIHERFLSDHGLRNLHAPFAEVFDLDAEVTEYILTEIGLDGDVSEEVGSSDVLDAARQQTAGFLDALAPEVDRSLLYSAQEHGEPVAEPLLVHGEGASIPGVVNRLASKLRREVESIAPATLARCRGSLSALCASPSLITAFGLAQHLGD